MYLLLALCLAVFSPSFTNAEYTNLACKNNTSAMVFLFEWSWADIARECPNLAKVGYCAVQTSIANEHALVDKRPWYERYQPVSYKIITRSGDESEFSKMVKACNKVGIRVVVDVCLNHMASGKGKGIGGSPYDASALSYPAVPFSKGDFHNGCDASDFQSKTRDCNLYDFPDVAQQKEGTRTKIAGYLNHLISLGVAGFRLDSAFYEWPKDIAAILSKVKDTQWGTRPFVYAQVQNAKPNKFIRPDQYFQIGRIEEFQLAVPLAKALLTKKLATLTSVTKGLIPQNNALTFLEMQTMQRGTLEGAQDYFLNYKKTVEYNVASAFVLGLGYGIPRIFSSFKFDDINQGPPTVPKNINQIRTVFNGNKCNEKYWACEHRLPVVQGMVRFNNLVHGAPVTNIASVYTPATEVVGVSRSNKGFFAFGSRGFSANLKTALAPGIYCDVIRGCSLKVTIARDGVGLFETGKTDIPVIALVSHDVANIL